MPVAAPAAPAAASDAELLARFVDAGSQEAFADLVRRHLPMVYASCRRRLGDPGAADDAAQAVFIVLSRRAGGLKADDSLAPWLYGTAQRVCANAARERRRRDAREQAAAIAPAAAGAERSDLQDAVDAALQALPEGYRRALVLHYLSGTSLGEVATAMGISRENAKKRVQRGVELLRRRIGAASGAAALAAFADHVPAPELSARIATGTTSPHVAALAAKGTALMSLKTATLPLAGLLIASTAGAVWLTAGDAPTPPTPAPAVAAPTPSWRLEPGQVFHYESRMQWTFGQDAAVKAAPNPMFARIIPERVTEVTLYRCQVLTVDDSGRAEVEARPEWTWRSLPKLGGALKAPVRVLDDHGAAQELTYHGAYVYASPGNGVVQVGVGPAGYAILPGERSNENDMGPIVTSLGVPDLLLPMQADAQLGFVFGAAQGTVTARGVIADGRERYTISWPKISGAKKDYLRQRVDVPMGAIDLSVSFAAEGTGAADVTWNRARGMADVVESSWSFDATVTLSQVGGGMSLNMPANVKCSRTARLLDDGHDRKPEPSELAGMMKLMVSERAYWWNLWSADGTDAGTRAVAFGILKDLADPDAAGPWNVDPTGENQDF
jgi:RNA polymerase sigma factor (sigma-70 family)